MGEIVFIRGVENQIAWPPIFFQMFLNVIRERKLRCRASQMASFTPDLEKMSSYAGSLQHASGCN
jgi:hypothetical protein